MIEKMNGCTETKDGVICGGKDISLSTPVVKGTDIEIETHCNTCNKTDTYKLPIIAYMGDKFIEAYNKRNTIVE